MRYCLAILCVLLTACGGETPISVTTKSAELSVSKPQDPVALQMMPVDFLVVNKTNQIEQIKNLFGENDSFIALRIRDYENLRVNLSDVLRYIRQQQAVIKYYQDMTQKQDEKNE